MNPFKVILHSHTSMTLNERFSQLLEEKQYQHNQYNFQRQGSDHTESQYTQNRNFVAAQNLKRRALRQSRFGRGGERGYLRGRRGRWNRSFDDDLPVREAERGSPPRSPPFTSGGKGPVTFVRGGGGRGFRGRGGRGLRRGFGGAGGDTYQSRFAPERGVREGRVERRVGEQSDRQIARHLEELEAELRAEEEQLARLEGRGRGRAERGRAERGRFRPDRSRGFRGQPFPRGRFRGGRDDRRDGDYGGYRSRGPRGRPFPSRGGRPGRRGSQAERGGDTEQTRAELDAALDSYMSQTNKN